MQSRNPPVYALHAGDPNPEERHNESLNFFYIMSTFGGRNRGHKNCLKGGIQKNKMEIKNKHAMNIWLSSLRIRAHLSWRTGKHLHVLHVLRAYSTCSYPGYQDTTTYAALRTNMSATPSSCLLQSLQSNGYVQSVPSHPPNTLTLKRSWSSSCARWLISWWPKHSNYDGVFLHAAHCLIHSTIVHSALLATANYSRTSHIYHISHLTIPTTI